MLTVAVLLMFRLLPGHGEVPLMPYAVIVVACLLGGALVAVLPWAAMYERGTGMRWMYAWSVLDIVLITAGVVVTGGERSEVWLFYILTTIFFAASYPVGAQLALLAFTIASYAGALWMTGWDLGLAVLFIRAASLGLLTFMAAFLAGELMDRSKLAAEAMEESEKRANLLAIVARAAREMATLGHDDLTDVVVGAVEELGFEASNLSIVDLNAETYTVVAGHDLPDDYMHVPYPLDRGITGMAVREERTVVLADYASHPASIEWFRDEGFRAVIAAPIWDEGKLVAVLIGGTRRERSISPEDIEAFELVAAQAGRAFENVRRFEEEHRLVQRLAELDRLKAEFLTMVSHELRTPLTTIEGMGLTLERRWDDLDDAVRRDFLARMNANAKSLDELVSKLLDFSRLETGTMAVQPEAVPVAEVVAEVLKRLGHLGQNHNLAVRIEPSLHIRGDRILLDRVLDNLISNALRYTPAGTDVIVTAAHDGPKIRVTISDGGPGMDPDELARLGERFFRGGDLNSRRIPGTGLGLALVKEILRLHGSELEVTSARGRGTTFSFALIEAEKVADVERTV